MKPMSQCARADLVFDISWQDQKHQIRFNESFFASGFNYYRDIFPGMPFEAVLNRTLLSDTVEVAVEPGDIVPEFSPANVHQLSFSRIYPDFGIDRLEKGRFYPKGMIKGLPGVFKANMAPFRVVDIDEKQFTADLNHPMAGRRMDIKIRVLNRYSGVQERGGAGTDWLDTILAGPGMQSWENEDFPQFFSDTAFSRQDESEDAQFYEIDRFVRHVDTTAGDNLSQLYGRVLSDQDRVLDLMAGWVSHLPESSAFSFVQGLGMNAGEMRENPQLTHSVTRDLNLNPSLPFEDQSFDAVVCSLSVEYLIHPVEVFKETARVLRPGGRFAVGFSNRWFPEKAIQVWSMLHEFERIGMVLQLFHKTGTFENLSAHSVRGYPRPMNDKYYPECRLSDPVYMVTGVKR